MALAAKMPWYHSTGNRDDGFESSSSASLLHSIYGSQASQLLFSSSSGYIGSESNISAGAAVGSSERPHGAVAPSAPARSQQQHQGSGTTAPRARQLRGSGRIRPKSSPASGIVSRAQRRNITSGGMELTVRKTSVEDYTSTIAELDEKDDIMVTATSPSSSSTLLPQRYEGVDSRARGRGRSQQIPRRPASAAVTSQRMRRPPSASHLSSAPGQRRPSHTRPKTALGIRQRKPSFSLVDLEEEESEQEDPAIIRATPPVKVTRQPEYFNFWLGKPLLERDFGVQVHKRKAWQRPKSDYGNRLGGGRGRGGDNEKGKGHGGDGQLETVIEQEDSTGGDSSRLRGKGEGEGEGDGKDKDGRRSGSGDGDDSQKGRKDGDSVTGSRRGSTDSKHKKKTKKSSKKSRSGKKEKAKVSLKAGVGAAEAADADDYFNEDALKALSWLDSGKSSKSTRFELPVDLATLTDMSPLQYLRRHCVISERRMGHCSEIFTKCDKDRDWRLNLEEMKEGLVKTHYSCVTPDQVVTVLELAKVPQDFKVDLHLFAALSCLVERVFDIDLMPGGCKEVVEVADFECLDWKIRGCNVNTPLYTVLTRL